MPDKVHSASPLLLSLRAMAVLALIVVAEIVNGTVRTLLITPWVGDFTARQIGTVTGCALILLIALRFSSWLKASTAVQRWAVGLIWMVLMLAFELSVGRLVVRASWVQLMADYDLVHGGLLGLGMLWLLCAPTLAAFLIRQSRRVR
jgi:hypothetical protein